jgi:hypothetical protein
MDQKTELNEKAQEKGKAPENRQTDLRNQKRSIPEHLLQVGMSAPQDRVTYGIQEIFDLAMERQQLSIQMMVSYWDLVGNMWLRANPFR